MTLQIIGKDRKTEQIVKLFDYKDVKTCDISFDELISILKNRTFDTLFLCKYQKEIIPYIDELSNMAYKTDYVDTIINKENHTIGINSLYHGIEQFLRNYSIHNKDVMLTGYTEITKTFEIYCENENVKSLYIVDMNQEQSLVQAYASHMDVQVLINTTKIGSIHDIDSMPMELSRFFNLEMVMDTINDPIWPLLILEARKSDISTLNGLPLEIYTIKSMLENRQNVTIPYIVTKKVIKNILYRRTNIVLIGMPSSGKSTIGKLLHKRLHKEFIDMDSMIVKKTGMKIPEIFEKSKEAGFRKIESMVSHELGMQHGIIIGTGGGTIKSEYNMDSLKRNGIIVFIDRKLDLLKTKDANRPLSSSKEAVKKLYEERYPLYMQYADIHIPNNGVFKNTIQEIVKECQTVISKSVK
ncbi:MAG: shikimate dehydrogenase [Holdemanella sp.]|nr:shikimate dehydrogenase [Holdemanella sp.]